MREYYIAKIPVQTKTTNNRVKEGKTPWTEFCHIFIAIIKEKWKVIKLGGSVVQPKRGGLKKEVQVVLVIRRLLRIRSSTLTKLVKIDNFLLKNRLFLSTYSGIAVQIDWTYQTRITRETCICLENTATINLILSTYFLTFLTPFRVRISYDASQTK